MKTLRFRWALVVSVLLGLFGSIQGAELGDPAPALEISEWIQGGEVVLAEGKGTNIYVIEFWATWCPPCLRSIPHLSKLQRDLQERGVVFVGITDEDPAVVKPFVSRMGGQMTYSVAVDKEGKTGSAYMEAYGIRGIPHAFVVDRSGRVVWNGHPMDPLEETLKEVLAGTFDLDRARGFEQARHLYAQFYELAGSGEKPEEEALKAAELRKLDDQLGGALTGSRFDEARTRREARFDYLAAGVEEAITTGAEADQIGKLETELKSVAPPGFDFKAFAAEVRLSRLFDDYYEAATTGRKEEAGQLAQQIGRIESDNVMVLNDIAWTMLTDEAIEARDLQVALRLAKRAHDASEGKDAYVTDTYARALFDSGEKTMAVTHARKALAICEDEALRVELLKALQRYEAAVEKQ